MDLWLYAKFEVSSSSRSKVMTSKPKSKMAAHGHLGFWFLSILAISSCSLRGSLAVCQIWSV